MKSVLNGITTIIFDLGGVVLNIDPDLSAREFSKLAKIGADEVYRIFLDSRWMPAFECGKITAEEFREQVRKELKTQIADRDINLAWNAMLCELPYQRLELLSGLRNKFRTLVLSNTNAIHVAAFTKMVAEVTSGGSILDHFHEVYYSNELGMRKPDREIYEFVLKSNNLEPSSTLFIDDMLPNIKAAEQCGIKTIHLTNQEDLFKIFN